MKNKNAAYDEVGEYEQDKVNGLDNILLDKFISLANIKGNELILDAMAGIRNLTRMKYNHCQKNSAFFMFTQEEKETISQAKNLIRSKLNTNSVINSPAATRDFLTCALAGLDHEVFSVLFLDQRHRVIEFVEMFRGTVDGTSVYPREVAKEALKYNAAAVIFCHNHPSGIVEPSRSDKRITKRLQNALQFFDIHTLDHIIVGKGDTYSFAECGLI